MLDNALFKLIISTVTDQLPNVGLTGLPIKRAFQPTQQGANKDEAAYLFKVGDHRYGYNGRSNVWDDLNDKLVHTETQIYETTFQMSALAIQDPKDTNQRTASDILNLLSAILQSEKTQETFIAQGVAILRITDIRNPYFKDDKGRHEAIPSFDFTLTHKQIVISETPVIESTELAIYDV